MIERFGKAIAPWGIVVFLIGMLAVATTFAQAPKIAEIKGGESLFDFLKRLPATMELQVAYCVALFGALGTFFNYAVRWMKKEIAGSLIHYLFVDNVRGTLLAYTSTLGAGVAMISMGAFEAPSGEFIGWFSTITATFGNGFFWDSVVNKGQRLTADATKE